MRKTHLRGNGGDSPSEVVRDVEKILDERLQRGLEGDRTTSGCWRLYWAANGFVGPNTARRHMPHAGGKARFFARWERKNHSAPGWRTSCPAPPAAVSGP